MNRDKKFLGFLTVIVAFFVVLNVISYFFYPAFMPWFEQRDAGKDIIKDTYDSQNAVNQYEEFREMYHDIEAQRNQIENTYDELDRFYGTYGKDPSEWSRTAEEQYSRIQKRITGNQNQLERLVAEYNAQSDMANREVFKCNLPYQVDDSFGISGPPGSGGPDEPVDTGPEGNEIDGEPVEAEQCDGLPDEISS